MRNPDPDAETRSGGSRDVLVPELPALSFHSTFIRLKQSTVRLEPDTYHTDAPWQDSLAHHNLSQAVRLFSVGKQNAQVTDVVAGRPGDNGVAEFFETASRIEGSQRL